VSAGHAVGYCFCIETQGQVAPSWLGAIDIVILSPKPPSSGMTVDWRRFDRAVNVVRSGQGAGRQVALKVPIFGGADLDWVESQLAGRYAVPLYLSVGNDRPPPAVADQQALLDRWRWLAEEVVRRRLDVIVTPQAHVLLYGNERSR
jgi:7-carboxy-7-deazaguanine synthase